MRKARKIREKDEKGEGRWMMDEKRTNKIRTVRDLKVYRKAFNNAMEIKDEGRWVMDEKRTNKIRHAKLNGEEG